MGQIDQKINYAKAWKNIRTKRTESYATIFVNLDTQKRIDIFKAQYGQLISNVIFVAIPNELNYGISGIKYILGEVEYEQYDIAMWVNDNVEFRLNGVAVVNDFDELKKWLKDFSPTQRTINRVNIFDRVLDELKNGV